MSNSIDELEKDALNPNVGVAVLLRKALVLAKRVGDTDFEGWVSRELKGYEDEDTLPRYRIITGRIVAQNPVRGWIPVMTDTLDAKVAQNMSTFHFRKPISDIEAYANGTPGTRVTSTVIIYYNQKSQADLMRLMDDKLIPAVEFNCSQFSRVLDIVRTTILEWVVNLSKKQIVEPVINTPITKPEIKGKGVRGYVSENKHWIFEGVGTQIIIWIGLGLFTLISIIVGYYFSRQKEIKQPAEVPAFVASPSPSVMPSATPTSTPSVEPSIQPSPVSPR